MVNPRKKPNFMRPNTVAYVRLGEKWRKPRGRHSKLAVREKSHGHLVAVGWGAPKNLRGLHPSGLQETLVHNIDELQKVDTKKFAARIAHTVGERKRKEILKKAEELKIKILNP